MVFVDLISENSSKLVFNYRPETDKAAPGIFEFDKNTGNYVLIKKSPDDTMIDSWYVVHAYDCADRMRAYTPVQQHRVAAWY